MKYLIKIGTLVLAFAFLMAERLMAQTVTPPVWSNNNLATSNAKQDALDMIGEGYGIWLLVFGVSIAITIAIIARRKAAKVFGGGGGAAAR